MADPTGLILNQRRQGGRARSRSDSEWGMGDPSPPVEPRLGQCLLLLTTLEPEHDLVYVFYILHRRKWEV